MATICGLLLTCLPGGQSAGIGPRCRKAYAMFKYTFLEVNEWPASVWFPFQYQLIPTKKGSTLLQAKMATERPSFFEETIVGLAQIANSW